MAINKQLDEYLKLPWSYRIEWWEDTGGYYAVTIDELPGVASDGSTPNDALENMRSALTAHLSAMLESKMEIPEPIRISQFKGHFSFRTSPEKHYKLAKKAKQSGRTISSLLDEALDHLLAS